MEHPMLKVYHRLHCHHVKSSVCTIFTGVTRIGDKLLPFASSYYSSMHTSNSDSTYHKEDAFPPSKRPIHIVSAG